MLAQFIGKLSATCLAVQSARLHHRSLQDLKHWALKWGRSYDQQVQMSHEAGEDLQWWIHHLSVWNGQQMHNPSPVIKMETDTSLLGWGAYCQGVLTGGRWLDREIFSIRTPSNPVQSPVLSERCEEQECPPQVRQHYHDGLHQSLGRNKVTLANQHSEGAMDMVLREGYNTASSVHPR